MTKNDFCILERISSIRREKIQSFQFHFISFHFNSDCDLNPKPNHWFLQKFWTIPKRILCDETVIAPCPPCHHAPDDTASPGSSTECCSSQADTRPSRRTEDPGNIFEGFGAWNWLNAIPKWEQPSDYLTVNGYLFGKQPRSSGFRLATFAGVLPCIWCEWRVFCSGNSCLIIQLLPKLQSEKKIVGKWR